MSEQIVATIEAVTSKEGATNGKPWRKFSVKTADGTFYSTFDAALAEQANAFKGKKATVGWKPSGSEGQYRDIVSVAAVAEAAPPAASGIPTERSETGEANWDIIGLRKTRCLLWAEYLSSPLAAKIAGTPESTVETIGQLGQELVERAERDIYLREFPAGKQPAASTPCPECGESDGHSVDCSHSVPF